MRRLLTSQAIAVAMGLLGNLYIVGTAGYARTLPAAILGIAIVFGPLLIGWLSGLLTARSHEDRWWMILVQAVAALVYLVILMPTASRVLVPASPPLDNDCGVGVLMVTTSLGTVGSVLLGTIFGSLVGHARHSGSALAAMQH